jgi:8-hydroxy-5-deazaflavin:NADPH oxidoreductase
MRIGIIGAGNIGGTLTRRLTQLGHAVSVANSRGPETLSALAEETGATAATAEDAARGAELVVITIPQKAIPAFDGRILEARAHGAPIVDTGNYYPGRDGKIEAIEAGSPESRWVAEELGHPVIKAFNNIQAEHLLRLGKPAGSEGRMALPVAGDDPGEKAAVMRLVDELGFDPVDAGSLEDSWRQQPATPCYAADLDAERLRQALADASPERPAQLRAGE